MCPRATAQLWFGFAASDACLALNVWHNGSGLFLGSRYTQKSKSLPTTTAETLNSGWGIHVWKVLIASFQKCIFSSHRSIVLTPLAACHPPKAPQCIVSGNLYFLKLNFHSWKQVELSSDLLKASWKKWKRQCTSYNFQIRHKREWKLPLGSRICLLLKRTVKLTASVSQGCGKRDKLKGEHCLKVECQTKRLGAGKWCMRQVFHWMPALQTYKQMLSKQAVILTTAGGCMWNLLESRRREIWRRWAHGSTLLCKGTISTLPSCEEKKRVSRVFNYSLR